MEKRGYPFKFTGEGGEYFRIWIVNITLTLLTLGIYSAWAKVRTMRWFYGHTLVDGHAFNYLATPKQLLKGRLIAIGCFFLYYIMSIISPVVAGVLLLVFMALSPWVVLSSLRFNAYHSAYRGLRFRFTGGLGEAYVIFLLLPLLMPFTLGLLFPYMIFRQVKYIADHSQYGTETSQYHGQSGAFWGLYAIVFLCMLLPLALIIAGSVLVFQKTAEGGILVMLGMFGMYAMSLVMAGLIRARTANLFYNHTELGCLTFQSTQRGRDLVILYLTNVILIGLTMGLFIPWAKVRMASYRAEHLMLVGPESLEQFVAGEREQLSASGSEMADVFDMDIGAGF